SNPAGGRSGRLASAAVPTACAAPGSPMSQRTHKPQQAANADTGTATGTAKQASTGTSAAVATLRAAEAVRGPFPVIGLGASAGGLIALRAFLEHMPASSGMAFVVILHLSPRHESSADTVLQQVTRMPVHQVAGPTLIEAGHVYVISPK